MKLQHILKTELANVTYFMTLFLEKFVLNEKVWLKIPQKVLFVQTPVFHFEIWFRNYLVLRSGPRKPCKWARRFESIEETPFSSFENPEQKKREIRIRIHSLKTVCSNWLAYVNRFYHHFKVKHILHEFVSATVITILSHNNQLNIFSRTFTWISFNKI